MVLGSLLGPLTQKHYWEALPWRLGRQSVLTALKDSLCRLGLSSVELYQLHWPGVWGNEGYIDGLGDAVEQGLVKAVGVSNYSEGRLRDAYERLKKRGVPLASNQVNYSLIYRAPEENGVKAACDELGITLIAYSPIAQGEVIFVFLAPQFHLLLHNSSFSMPIFMGPYPVHGEEFGSR
uniref:Aldo/keto reductase family protein n=1 Tax=Rhizophora mucronata TaxID=61149 RepID=A0A2P2L7Z6_RHIMU